MELVCACVRWPIGQEERLDIVQRSLGITNWSLVRMLIVRHRVAGLAANALLAAAPSLPDDMKAWCAEWKNKVGFSELAAAGEAKRLVRLFAENEIRARLLKGPAVSIAAFGRLGLRINRDLDILVDIAHRETAGTLLETLGYVRVEPGPQISDAAYRDWLQHRKDFVYARPGGMLVEIHWRLFNNTALLPKGHLSPPEQIQNGPFLFDTLSPDDNILYLCVHGAEHAWSRLKWLADLAALLQQRDSTSLATLLIKARHERVYPAVGSAVLLCARHLGLRISPGMVGDLQRSLRIRLLTSIAEKSLFEGDGRELEEQRFGTTWKNLSHYVMASGWGFLRREMRFDLMDITAAGLSEKYRAFGPFARPAAFIERKLRRNR